jgi:hypothetical protein
MRSKNAVRLRRAIINLTALGKPERISFFGQRIGFRIQAAKQVFHIVAARTADCARVEMFDNLRRQIAGQRFVQFGVI